MRLLMQDICYAIRTLSRSPAFSLVAILTLALGIGANTAIFSVVDSVLLSPLPYDSGDRLVLVRQQRPLADIDNLPFSVHEIADYRSQNQTLDALVEYHHMSFILLGHGEPIRVETGVVSWNFFDVFGVKPILGRSFLPSEEKVGSEAVFMMSYEFWQGRFGGNPEIVGQTFEMNDKIHTLVGVLPPLPQFPDLNDVYMPTSDCPFRSRPGFIANRNARMMQAFGRLKSGTPLEQARADLATIADRLRAAYPDSYPEQDGYAAATFELREELTRQARPTLLILLGTVGFVLLIVCANLANLTLARMVQRQKEIAVRSALGAGRRRLIRQILTESTLLSLAGGALGVLLAAAGLSLLVDFTSRFTTRASEISIDGSVLTFTLLVSMGTGMLFGILPALPLSRNPVDSLREGGGRASLGIGGMRLRSLLIVTQVAMSFMLLIGAGLMVRSMIKLQQVDAGFDPQKVLTALVSPNWSKYGDPVTRRDFWRRVLAEMRSHPGVLSAAAGRRIPLNQTQPFSQGFRIEGRSVEEGQRGPEATVHTASSHYFETLGIPLLRGRTFTDMDHANAPRVVVINQTLARHYWGNKDPTGQRITPDDGKTWFTVVGVVGDVRTYGLNSQVEDEMYVPLLQSPFSVSRLVARSVGDPRKLSQDLREAVYSIDTEQAVAQVRTLEEVRRESVASPRLTTALLGLFAALALAITVTGITAVIAFSVSQRTREIGIRIALGAARSSVLGLLLRQGLLLVVIGLVIGIVAAFALSWIMSGLLFDVQPNDPATFMGVSLLLLAVAGAACFLPARRATGIDPIEALRAE